MCFYEKNTVAPGSSRGLVVKIHDLYVGVMGLNPKEWMMVAGGHLTLIHFQAPAKSPC